MNTGRRVGDEQTFCPQGGSCCMGNGMAPQNPHSNILALVLEAQPNNQYPPTSVLRARQLEFTDPPNDSRDDNSTATQSRSHSMDLGTMVGLLGTLIALCIIFAIAIFWIYVRSSRRGRKEPRTEVDSNRRTPLSRAERELRMGLALFAPLHSQSCDQSQRREAEPSVSTSVDPVAQTGGTADSSRSTRSTRPRLQSEVERSLAATYSTRPRSRRPPNSTPTTSNRSSYRRSSQQSPSAHDESPQAPHSPRLGHHPSFPSIPPAAHIAPLSSPGQSQSTIATTDSASHGHLTSKPIGFFQTISRKLGRSRDHTRQDQEDLEMAARGRPSGPHPSMSTSASLPDITEVPDVSFSRSSFETQETLVELPPGQTTSVREPEPENRELRRENDGVEGIEHAEAAPHPEPTSLSPSVHRDTECDSDDGNDGPRFPPGLDLPPYTSTPSR